MIQGLRQTISRLTRCRVSLASEHMQRVNRTRTGGEIRVHDEYRANGRGGWAFVGYLVDNGQDRRQVASWLDVLRLVEEWGGIAEDRVPY